MLNLIDSRTLFLASAMVSGAIFPFMYLTMRNRKTFPGYGRWTTSMALFSAGLFLMGLRGIISALVSVVWGNLLGYLAMLLAAQGVRKFCDQRWHGPWIELYSAALYCLQMYYFFVRDSLQARVVISSLLLVSVGLYTALPLLGTAPAGRKFGYRFTAGVFLFCIPQMFFRFFTQVHPALSAGFFVNSVPNVVYYFTILFFIVGLAFSFFLLTNERLVAELRVANESLVAETSELLHMQERLARAERMEAVGRLAGGIAHNFNNQMCIINLYCEHLLESPEVPESIRPSLERISDAGQRTSEITGRLLQFARTKALKNSKFHMVRWLHTISGDLKRVLGPSIELRIESVSPDLFVFADADQLAGVMLGIAGNARQAMALGGKWTLLAERIRLTEAGHGRELGLSDGDYVCLSATDTGCGMDEETVKRIFEPFYSTKNLAVADGLGLASALGLLQQSGGTLTASSTVGEGTTLRLYLPAADSIPN